MIVRHCVFCESVAARLDGRDDLGGLGYFLTLPSQTALPSEWKGDFMVHLCVTGLRRAAVARLEWVFVHDQNHTLSDSSISIPLPPTPAHEVMIPIRLNPLPLRSEGQYELRVWWEREVIASVPVMVARSAQA